MNPHDFPARMSTLVGLSEAGTRSMLLIPRFWYKVPPLRPWNLKVRRTAASFGCVWIVHSVSKSQVRNYPKGGGGIFHFSNCLRRSALGRKKVVK